MSSTLVLLGVFILCICAGIPIAAGLGVSAVAALLVDGLPLYMIAQRMMTQINTFTVMAILFFMLSGEIMCKGTMTEKLVNWAQTLVGHIAGGLAIAAGVAATFFSALSGSSAATCASIGSIMIGKMQEHGFPKKFTASVIATSGITGLTLGLNLWNALVVGILGVPGLVLLLLVQWVL